MKIVVFLALAAVAQPQPLGPGLHERSLAVDGYQRQYLVYVPARGSKQRRWPVVLAFHGGGSNARSMIRFCGLNDKADRSGFVVVYPNGTGRVERARTFNAGNCCGFAQRRKVDDVKFVSALLEDLGQLLPIDAGRIYATGMSNGAMLCYRLASELSRRIVAIAPVAGPMGTETCSPERPVSVCHFHGTDDQFAAYEGGPGPRSLTRTNFYSVRHTIDAWVRANGCNPKPQITELPQKVDDGTRIRRAVYSGGREGSEVVLYTIEGGGHTWPGRTPPLRFLGKSTKNLSANDVMWEFFQRHVRR